VNDSPAPLVDIARDIEASVDTVWSILSTPALFSEWMDGEVTFSAEAGSPFRAAFPNFQTVVAGEIVSVDPGARSLRVTWGVESGPQAETFPAGCSVVEFRVREAEIGCRVEVTHSRLPSELEAKQHEAGWRFHLSRMELFANRHDLEPGLARTMAGWFAAWNDHDDASRLETLKSCCSADVEYRDEWTALTGIELLSMHIGNCFKYMPGYALAATGDVRICRGEALVGWSSTGPAGPVEGHNVVRALPDGTIARVTAFPRA